MEHPGLHSAPSWATGDGRFMARWDCLGGDAWGWVLIGADVAIVALYLAVCSFWVRAYLDEAPADRRPGLLLLALIFGFCALNGYGLDAVMFWWPGYRAAGLARLPLIAATAVFAMWGSRDLRAALGAGRLLRERDEALARTEQARRSAEGAQQVAEAALQVAAELAPAGVAFVGVDERLPYLACNARWLRMYGLSGVPAQYRGRSHHAEVFSGLYAAMPHWQDDHDLARAGHPLDGEDVFQGEPITWAIRPVLGGGRVVALAFISERAADAEARRRVAQTAATWERVDAQAEAIRQRLAALHTVGEE